MARCLKGVSYCYFLIILKLVSAKLRTRIFASARMGLIKEMLQKHKTMRRVTVKLSRTAGISFSSSRRVFYIAVVYKDVNIFMSLDSSIGAGFIYQAYRLRYKS